MKRFSIVPAIGLSLLAVLDFSSCFRERTPSPLLERMPRLEDHSRVWWAEGFPAVVESAPWLRVIRSGRYALAMETGTLRIPHFGPLPSGPGYRESATADDGAWRDLPGAELELAVTVGGKRYRAISAAPWSQFGGPRLIDSGRFVQRVDVTGLRFADSDGNALETEARLETVAWPDRLAFILSARPGVLPIPVGENAFGHKGGGYGFDGTNHLEIPHRDELEPEHFTLGFWAFVPTDHRPSRKSFPWLACKNAHEQADGNYGLVLLGGRPQARLNIGGGRDNTFNVTAPVPLKSEAWHHLAMSYDGETLSLFVNGEPSGETHIGRRRTPGSGGLAFGRRQDNSGDGYHFRGILDEIRLYPRALSAGELKQSMSRSAVALSGAPPVFESSFRETGTSSLTRPHGEWKEATMEVTLRGLQGGGTVSKPALSSGGAWSEAALSLDPGSPGQVAESPVVVRASEIPGGALRPVSRDPARGWHRVDLDGIVPVVPEGKPDAVSNPNNYAIERVKLVLSNPSDIEQPARLLFEKTGAGFRQRIGAAVTGVSAILRDKEGNPTGIPVQLSKNWHNRPEGGVYTGAWFHGFSLLHLPPRSETELELTLVYGHWGGLPAASHAQLCLVGWGSNQLWDQSAMGSWGESICYEPDQVQGRCAILDVRPMMVKGMSNDGPWQWTHNVGGGDAFRLFAPDGSRLPPARMRTTYERQGPCLTEVTYAGGTGAGLEHSFTTSLARTDDLVRATYRLRLEVKEDTAFSRFVLFQIGADTYSYTGERKIALGNAEGLIKEWPTRWGGEVNRTEPLEASGRVPWVSMHEAVARHQKDEKGAWANRGFVIREWKAKLGGKDATPWIVERGVHARGSDTSTVDIVPPPGVMGLVAGDFVEATIEYLIMPQFAADYYGPNDALRTALTEHENTWRMIHREAVGNIRQADVGKGTLLRSYPALEIGTIRDGASFSLRGGIGFIPVSFRGLTSPEGYELRVDGAVLDQSVHGRDFWQTDYDSMTRTWSRTYNLPAPEEGEAPRVELISLP